MTRVTLWVLLAVVCVAAAGPASNLLIAVAAAVLLALLTTVIVAMTPAVHSAPWVESQIVPYLQVTLTQVKPLLPSALHDYIPA